jgi:hypothetical protein
LPLAYLSEVQIYLSFSLPCLATLQSLGKQSSVPTLHSPPQEMSRWIQRRRTKVINAAHSLTQHGSLCTVSTRYCSSHDGCLGGSDYSRVFTLAQSTLKWGMRLLSCDKSTPDPMRALSKDTLDQHSKNQWLLTLPGLHWLV